EHPEIAKSYNNLGNSFESKGEYDKAIKYKTKAIEIQVKNFGIEHPNLAIYYNNLGNSFDSKGEYDKAIEYKKKSIEIQLKTLGTEHPILAIYYSNLGNSFNSKGEYDKAIEYNQKALEIQLKTLKAEHPILARLYNNLGNSFEAKGEYEKAIDYYQKTITTCRYSNQDFSKINSFEYLLDGIMCASQAFQTKYVQNHTSESLTQSFQHALNAISATEYQNTHFTNESSKSFWLTKNYPIYEQAISVSLLKANVDQNDTIRQSTFSYAEKSKASLLQAQIKAADAINFSGIPDSLLQKEHNLRIDLTWREKQRQSLLDKGLSETDTNTLRISSIIFDLKRDYEALKLRFETQYPKYYRLKYDRSTVSLQYVQDTLLQPKQALLEYFVGDSSIYLFVVRPDTMIVQEIKRDFPLEDWIEQFRQGLYGFYTAPKADQTDALYDKCLEQYLDYAPKLYEKLFAPVKAFLPEQVILVPDGPLGYVPFDALLTAAPKDPNDFKHYPYLLNKHQFSYTYSATLLKEMRDKQHHHEPTKEFVAFAPFYDGDTTLLANMYQYDDLMRKDMQPLAYSGAEVAAASKMMHGEIVAGAAATEERFTQMAGDYRILHLATHGRADNRVGDYAFLAFTEIKDSIENELLYVKDL
ncbi:MAG: tetratricopeptide repeat protein, partial [Bacteroidota bacterium]